ncbi:hypothetical protein LGH83_04660 [Lichenihabitans sp. PAMC28606]|uniref:DUF6894 family protein n=1 Tax=Lichenihabitans sp. PAMC28606 TaxID=2880932 RepID=UPI001D0AF470|nr:hypothetical protein [Lichenihabitans sp. PAMC28606]UDL95519.1 hypothetical protein LGH83_04660 [Lichenihabitans sp. PAMC28606]
MPRFYFDSHDGDQFIRDDLGVILTDNEKARTVAIDALPDIARDVLPDGDHRVMIVLVRDEMGSYIFEAKLSLAARWLVGDG